MAFRVLVVGGYGLFGGLLATRLAKIKDLELLIAGRNQKKGQAFVDSIKAPSRASIEFTPVDVNAPSFKEHLSELGPKVIINTAGPFQGQDYHVARSCAEAGVDYIDLADGRDYVSNFGEALDEIAKEHDVRLITGASSVPALSSAALYEISAHIGNPSIIDIGITPGNKTKRGLATVQAILDYCGGPLRVWEDGAWETHHAWTENIRHEYPDPVGERLLTICDVPDLELFPTEYSPVETVRFRAGLDLGMLHYAMNLMARIRKGGLVKTWVPYAKLLFNLSNLFRLFGSDAGAMHVSAVAKRPDSRDRKGTWTLVAADGDGPYVPTLAAAAVVRRLMEDRPVPKGAYACVRVLDLSDFQREMEGLSIETKIEYS